MVTERSAMSDGALKVTLAPGVEVLAFDSSFPTKPLLATKSGKHYQIDGPSKELLLSLRDQPYTTSDIVARLGRGGGVAYSRTRIESSLNHLVRLGLVSCADASAEQCVEDEPPHTALPPYFLFGIRLISERQLRPITRRLAPLFDPRVVRIALPIVAFLNLALGRLVMQHWDIDAPAYGRSSYLFVTAGAYAMYVLHELGHASACNHFGVRHGPFGFGMYLVIPALYVDVTESWRLSRWKRFIVDAGGIYINLIASLCLMCAYLLTGLRWTALLAGTSIALAGLNLYPFVRFDGYWIFSDILGVPNLMAANREMSTWLWNCIRRVRGGRPAILSIRPRYLLLLYLAYYPAWAVFTILTVYRLVTVYFLAALRHLPQTWLFLTGSEVFTLPGLLQLPTLVVGFASLFYILRVGTRVLVSVLNWILRATWRPELTTHDSGSTRHAMPRFSSGVDSR